MKKLLKCVTCVLALAIVAGAGFGIGFWISEAKLIKELEKVPVSLPQGFTVTAHTGCESTKMNSLEAIKQGVEAGAQTVEFDINFKGDGTPVLSHDPVKDSEKCPTLDEAFALVGTYDDITVNVDLKATDNLAEIERLAEKYDILDRIFYTGVGNDFLDAVQKDSPKVKYFLNVKFDDERKFDPQYIAEFVELVKSSGAVGINLPHSCLTAEMVRQFHEKGLLVSVYTVDGYKDMLKAVYLAPDNITTRKPSKLVEALNRI